MNDLHQPYPWTYRNAEMMLVDITCADDEVAALIPAPLQPRRPARAVAWTLRCEEIAGAGAYHEFTVHVLATENGRTVMGTPYIYVDNDAAMASGREVLGVPKRLARIEQGYHNDQLVARVHRSGVDFATLGMTLDREGDATDIARYTDALSRPSSRRVDDRVVTGAMEVTVHRVVHGRGFVDARPSAADPFYRLRPEAVGTAALLRVDLTLLPPVVAPHRERESAAASA